MANSQEGKKKGHFDFIEKKLANEKNWHCWTIIYGIILALSCAKAPLPTHYGVFLVDNKKLIQLKNVETCREANSYKMRNYYRIIDGYGDYLVGIQNPPEVKTTNQKVYIVAYIKSTPSYTLHKLEYYNRVQKSNGFLYTYCYAMWLPEQKIDLSITPIERKPDMYRLTPSEILKPGHYVICLEDFKSGQNWNFIIEETEKSKAEAEKRESTLKSKFSNSVITFWEEYAIVREPATESGDMPAHIFKWENKQWKEIGFTTEGFYFIEQVKQYILNLTEEGANKLGLSTMGPMPSTPEGGTMKARVKRRKRG